MTMVSHEQRTTKAFLVSFMNIWGTLPNSCKHSSQFCVFHGGIVGKFGCYHAQMHSPNYSFKVWMKVILLINQWRCHSFWLLLSNLVFTAPFIPLSLSVPRLYPLWASFFPFSWQWFGRRSHGFRSEGFRHTSPHSWTYRIMKGRIQDDVKLVALLCWYIYVQSKLNYFQLPV